MNYIICHYHEIGLKGKNRGFFERKLIENIKQALNSDYFKYVRRISGRILIELTEKGIKKEKAISEKLKNIFGIAYFAFATSCKQEIKSIQKTAHNLLKEKKFKTFRIETKRSKKDFLLNSQQINEKVGAFIIEKLNKKVDLKKTDLVCFIEIVEKFAFLYLKKIQGSGGLPIGASGKAIALLSGGIDSPVAAYYAMKRGVEMVFVHFHSYKYTDKVSLEKVFQLVKILNKFQIKSKLYLVPFDKIQKEILLKTPEKLRVILYRRFMMKIAENLAKKEKAMAIVTGESIGQVASQTLENLKAIEGATNLLVTRPLIGFDKQEIIDKAKKIGSYEVSVLPHQDCCARFLPRHPETKAKIEEIEKAEKKLDIEKLIKKAVENTEIRTIE